MYVTVQQSSLVRVGASPASFSLSTCLACDPVTDASVPVLSQWWWVQRHLDLAEAAAETKDALREGAGESSSRGLASRSLRASCEGSIRQRFELEGAWLAGQGEGPDAARIMRAGEDAGGGSSGSQELMDHG